MNAYERNELNSFIVQVFNYFNGQVNIFNAPAVLFIDIGEKRGSNVAASSTLPNIVRVFPEVTIRMFDDLDAMKHEILITIIHELLHLDQVICYPRMRMDWNYKKEIEDTVEYYSHMFVAQHLLEIEQVFGLHYIDPKSFSEILTTGGFLGHYFHRRTYETHMLMILQDMMATFRNNVIDGFLEAFRNPKSLINMIIDGQIKFTLKNQLEAMPVAQLNSVLYDSYFKYNFRGTKMQISRYDQFPIYEIDIKTNCDYKLYKIL